MKHNESREFLITQSLEVSPAQAVLDRVSSALIREPEFLALLKQVKGTSISAESLATASEMVYQEIHLREVQVLTACEWDLLGLPEGSRLVALLLNELW